MPLKLNLYSGDRQKVATAVFAVVGVEVTRPADTTAYAAGDAVADSTSAPTALAFLAAARESGGGGYVTRARIVTDQKTNVAAYRLWLFSASPTVVNDNAVFPLLYTEKATRLGYIDIGPLATEDTTSTCAQAINADIRLAYTCAATTLFGLLETKTAFTPASGQKVYVELLLDQN